MFALSAAVLALASTALAKPVSINRPQARQFIGSDFGGGSFGGESFGGFGSQSVDESASISASESVSFDNWGGFDALSGFDNFYGVDNFCGVDNVQVFAQEEVVVCEQVDITVIQQNLAILQEFAKRIITEQICQVEVQTIVFSQFSAGLLSFSDDIRHISDRHVSFDSSIASHISDIVSVDGSINTNDFGFLGSDIGASSVIINGDNWVASSSPISVSSAFEACQQAVPFSLSLPVSGSVSSVPPSGSVSSDPSLAAPSDVVNGDPTADEAFPTDASGAVAPTDFGTDASAPTDTGAAAAVPTDLGTDASAPTDTGAAAAVPTDLGTDASAPTDAATDASAPTDTGAAAAATTSAASS